MGMALPLKSFPANKREGEEGGGERAIEIKGGEIEEREERVDGFWANLCTCVNLFI